MRTNEDATTQQRNKETVRRLFAAFTANDAGAMDELLAPRLHCARAAARAWRWRGGAEGHRSRHARGTARLPL
jgi:ketosteroid isomerase-like protein